MKQNKYSLRTSQLGWQKATVFCTRKPQTTNNICILYFISKQGSLNTKCKKQNFTNSKESTVLYSGMKALTAESILCSCHTCVSLTRCFLWINCLNGTTRFLSHVNNVFEIHDNSGHNTSKKIFYSKKSSDFYTRNVRLQRRNTCKMQLFCLPCLLLRWTVLLFEVITVSVYFQYCTMINNKK